MGEKKRERVKGLHQLSPLEVQNADRSLHDGGGLWLRVNKQTDNARWSLRYTNNGVRSELALSRCHRHSRDAAAQSMKDARNAAAAARSRLALGRDPLSEKRAEKKAAHQAALATKAQTGNERRTLARFAREYHAEIIEKKLSPKYAQQWINSLERYVPAEIWHKPLADVTRLDLLDALRLLQERLPETADRVRRRLDAVFNDAQFRGYCEGNPALDVKRKLREYAGKRREKNFAALPYPEAPAFMAALRLQEGVAARALEFGMLTAARTNEILGATFDEIRDGVWTVPGDRMKGGEDHVVHLTPRAVEIVQVMRAFGSAYVFPSPVNTKRPLSAMGMLMTLRRMKMEKRTTVHGLCRSTFSTWANETDAARPDVIEACLAHKEVDRIRAAYNRAKFQADRKALLLRWASYLGGQAANNVVPLLKAA